MDHPDDLLEQFAFGDAPDVGPHVSACPSCAAQVELARQTAGWLASSHSAPPPSALRSRVLAAAVSVRPSSSGSALSAYVSEAADLGILLESLSTEQWAAPTVDGRSVSELVRHLAENDGNVLVDLGVAVPSRWRGRSDLLLRTAGEGGEVLNRSVRLAGKAPVRRPLREAILQRAFETWIHRDDIRAAVALPLLAPAPAHLARILSFGLAMLPAAMDAAGRGRLGAVSLHLTGPGGGTHVVPLSSTPSTSSLAGVAMPAERFGRLMAGRVPVTATVAVLGGSRAVALDFLTVAATLGCE